MVIRQRRTMMDPLFVDVVCPFLRGLGLERLFPIGRLWNRPSPPQLAPVLIPIQPRWSTLIEVEELRLVLAAFRNESRSS